MAKKQIKEKRKLRIVNGKRTLTTYRKFRKKFPISDYSYNRKTKTFMQKRETVVISKPIKKKERKIDRDVKEQQQLLSQRIRKQVVLNFRTSEEPYAISIRAITINPEITEHGLLIAVRETMSELSYNFNNFNKRYLGYEETKIANQEDKRLNNGAVYVEVMIKRNKPLVFIK